MGITERIDQVTLVSERFSSPALPAPRAVKIELTGRCNLRCQYCSLRMRPSQPTGDMDFEFFKRITTEMREAGVEEIGAFYIGESFMSPELLVRAIRWCKQELQFPYVFLTSNASLAVPEAVEACMAAGLDSLKWSVNAADEEQYKTLMGVSARYFRKAVSNIREAWHIRRRGGYSCGLYASSIFYGGEQDEMMKALLQEHVIPFVDQHYWLPLFGQMTQQSADRAAELGFVPTAGNQGRLGALRDPLPCWAVLTEGHVTAEGKLSACCFDADGRFTMADLTKVSFMDGWNSAVFQELRAAHLRRDVTGTVCEQCVAYS